MRTGSTATLSCSRTAAAASGGRSPSRAAVIATCCQNRWRLDTPGPSGTHTVAPGRGRRSTQLRTRVVLPLPVGPCTTHMRTSGESSTSYSRGRSTIPATATGSSPSRNGSPSATAHHVSIVAQTGIG